MADLNVDWIYAYDPTREFRSSLTPCPATLARPPEHGKSIPGQTGKISECGKYHSADRRDAPQSRAASTTGNVERDALQDQRRGLP
jgi:hypothetical protein